jgi:hypothetical protein
MAFTRSVCEDDALEVACFAFRCDSFSGSGEAKVTRVLVRTLFMHRMGTWTVRTVVLDGRRY